jgi:threonine synthase
LGANIWLKTEFQQFTGSFKERGARNAIMQLLRSDQLGEDVKRSGVIAASAGNHALAMAYHGMQLGVPVTVVMPTVAPLAKVDKCRVSSFLMIHVCIAVKVEYVTQYMGIFVFCRNSAQQSSLKDNILANPKNMQKN